MITILILSVAGLFLAFLIVIGIPGTPNFLAWKLSGIWANQADTLQIMIHGQDSNLHGHVVSAQINQVNDKPVVGKMVVDNVQLKSAWKWSKGKYIDPYTLEEFDLMIKMKNANTLSVCFLRNQNIIKSEEWKLVNALK